MLVDSGNSAAGSAVAGAIREASQATGTNFNYLLATAQVESGLNPHAGASTSSARGLFQFIEQTWFATMKQAGGPLGYGRYSDAISKTASGTYEVRDPVLRSEILKLRSDPTANAVMAGAFTKSNADVLSQRLGRAPSEGELYIAHFLGVGGAARLITVAGVDPDARASHFFSHAAQANPSIFYDRSGAPRSVARVRDLLTARYDVARGNQDRATFTAAAARTPAPALAAPDTAGIAGAFAAATNPAALPEPAAAAVPVALAAPAAPTAAKPERQQIFNGLFADADRPASLTPLASALWGVPNANVGATRKTASGGWLDLFRDPVKRS
jgi:hypothetical protein